MTQGNFLGIVNNPSNTSVSGVWGLVDSYGAMKSGNWVGPTIPVFYKTNLTKGFWRGGFPYPNPKTAVGERTTYSTETTAAVTAINLSSARNIPGTSGTPDKCFFMGGSNTSDVLQSMADVATYATETATIISGAALVAANGPQGAGNNDKAFHLGGAVTSTKITYSSETSSAAAAANLGVSRYYGAFTGNSTKGFYNGGDNAYSARSDKVDYTTETSSGVAGANLSVARWGVGANGNETKGFYCGGYTGAYSVVTDRTTFSTETTAAVSGANLSVARLGLASCGTLLKGFWAGGDGSVLCERITYNTETIASVTSGNLSLGRHTLGAG